MPSHIYLDILHLIHLENAQNNYSNYSYKYICHNL